MKTALIIYITSVYTLFSRSNRKRVDNSRLDLAKLLDEYDKREERRMTLLFEIEARTREGQFKCRCQAKGETRPMKGKEDFDVWCSTSKYRKQQPKHFIYTQYFNMYFNRINPTHLSNHQAALNLTCISFHPVLYHPHSLHSHKYYKHIHYKQMCLYINNYFQKPNIVLLLKFLNMYTT